MTTFAPDKLVLTLTDFDDTLEVGVGTKRLPVRLAIRENMTDRKASSYLTRAEAVAVYNQLGSILLANTEVTR
jgi:hypothetical protein